MLLKKSTWVIAVLQSLLIVAAFVTAWLLRFDFSLPHPQLLFAIAPLLVSVRVLAMWRFNLIHGYWRYTGVSDAVAIGKAVALGSAAFFVTLRIGLGMKAFPLSIYFLEALLTWTALCGVRVAFRIMHQVDQRHR